jgi:hypothetical protein
LLVLLVSLSATPLGLANRSYFVVALCAGLVFLTAAVRFA